MYFRLIKIFVLFSFLALSLAGCASSQRGNKSKPFDHNTPLIKEDIKKSGTIEVDKTVRMGPKPNSGYKFIKKKKKNIVPENKKLFAYTWWF